MRHAPSPPTRLAWRIAALAAWLGAASAAATPLQFLPVNDPLERELRLLDLLPVDSLENTIRLPHLHSRPLQVEELRGPGDAAAWRGVAGISRLRIERWLARDLPGPSVAPPGTIPRLFQLTPDPRSRFEISAALEGRAEADEHDVDVVSGSGVHVRTGAQVERFFAYSDLLFGQLDSAQTVTDPLVANTDLALTTDDSYVGWAAVSGVVATRFGVGRIHWGPGEEAGLLLSRTGAATGGLLLRASIVPYRLDFFVYNATLAQAEGRRLAAHRIEWQPLDALRVGLAETAVYHAAGWDVLHACGMIPYSVVQRLENLSEPDSARDLRNNVTGAFDAAWRVAPGSRVYAEMLLDDVHVRTAEVPNKWGYLLGLEGVGRVGTSRVSWIGEFARLSRYVYSSFYSAALEASGKPLGYPTGPDSRRMRVRVACDVGPQWQAFGAAGQTDRGEGSINTPYVPGTPYGDPMVFEGVVERSREFDFGVRWWPASGVDVSLSAGWSDVHNVAHVAGAGDSGPTAAIVLQLVR